MRNTFVVTLALALFLAAGVGVANAGHKPGHGGGGGGGGGFPAPSNLVATTVSSSQIDLSWTDNSDNEDDFRIERSLDGSNFSEVAQVGANVTSYSDTGLDANTEYHYRVRAHRTQGSKDKFSDYSNVDSATTFPLPPADPSNLVATAMEDTSGTTTLSFIEIVWQDNSDNEDNFVLERSLDGSNFSTLVTLTANTTSWDDYAVSSGQTYYYRVKATNAGGDSGYSNVDSATAL